MGLDDFSLPPNFDGHQRHVHIWYDARAVAGPDAFVGWRDSLVVMDVLLFIMPTLSNESIIITAQSKACIYAHASRKLVEFAIRTHRRRRRKSRKWAIAFAPSHFFLCLLSRDARAATSTQECAHGAFSITLLTLEVPALTHTRGNWICCFRRLTPSSAESIRFGLCSFFLNLSFLTFSIFVSSYAKKISRTGYRLMGIPLFYLWSL